MKSKIQILALVVIIALIGYGVYLFQENASLKKTNEVQKSNIESLMLGTDTLRLKNNQQALEVRNLQLTAQDFQVYKKDAMQTIENMGIKIKNLQSYSRTDMTIKIPVEGKVKLQSQNPQENELADEDSIDDCLEDYVAVIDIHQPYLDVQGTIIGDSISLSVNTEVKLEQAATVIPKHKFLWWSWGVKGIKQIITTDNPYVEIKYSEYINIEK